ncbi:hypothetical protein SERLADRAFT_432149 [Serpula lacrymans var. lacrymans S7.9]|uniref:DDE-1 domain-containing protein n=1 Tax=Serpula lacrymans var. lacrymans (strain S7.9) TaxID=578457 RepID=F8NEE4_SERL9|nr:uncharacterized protein SERLADRAFT_432149 [Serpula lacrymans var. lacrymans S7.9]EGO30578.1 hypothetical protein SERLADRAFT_432149 [Serpula lacrymans var. lacrymans S7.9]
MIELAVENQIHLLFLPLHTTHHLQPLDVGVFGPMQKAWYNCCKLYTARTGEGICQHHAVKEYWEACKGVFVTNTILQAWHKSALCPLNPGLFTAADYALSASTSTANHAPLSYPDTFPDGWMDGTSLYDPDYAPNDAAPSPDSDISSEGAGDSDDGSDSSICEDEGEDSNVNMGSRDANIASGGSTSGSFPSSCSSSCASTPGAMLVKLHPTSLPIAKSKKNLVAIIHKLQVERDEALWERDTMQGHSVFMMHEFEHVKDWLNLVKGWGKQRKGLWVHSELLTSAELRARHLAEEEAHKEKERKAAEAKANKDAKAAEHQVQMSLLDGTEVFNGALMWQDKAGPPAHCRSAQSEC